MKYFSLALLALLLPFMSFAQTITVTTLATGFLNFVNTALIPFILGIGFLFFAINVIRYFVIGGSSQEGREKAKNLAIYGVFAFVIILIFWGVVNMLASSIGLDGKSAPTSDYIGGGSGSNNSAGATNSPGNVSGSGNSGIGGNGSNGSGTGNNRGSIDPCDSGAAFDANGRPCGIY